MKNFTVCLMSIYKHLRGLNTDPILPILQPKLYISYTFLQSCWLISTGFFLYVSSKNLRDNSAPLNLWLTALTNFELKWWKMEQERHLANLAYLSQWSAIFWKVLFSRLGEISNALSCAPLVHSVFITVVGYSWSIN